MKGKEYQPEILRKRESKDLSHTFYAIGEEHKPYEFGMWAGPSLSEIEMLNIPGKSDKSCIIRFTRDGNEIRWRWRFPKWIQVQDE